MGQVKGHVVGAVGRVGVFMLVAMVTVLVEQHRRVLVGAATGATGAVGAMASASVQLVDRHLDRTAR